MVGLNANGRIISKINNFAAQFLAGRVKLILNFAACHEQALDIRILDGLDVDRPGSITRDKFARRVNFDANAFRVVATDDFYAGFGIGAYARLNDSTLFVGGHTADKSLAGSFEMHQASLGCPGEGFADPIAILIELLGDRCSGDEASKHLEIGSRLDAHECAAAV